MSNEIAPDFTPSTAGASAGPESLGAWLAQVRASYGAEQREVAHHLGLNPALIQALEADDFARLGPPVFVRGYLSRYARLLNLPEAAVLERYRQQSGAGQDPPPLKVVHPRRRQTRVRDLRGLFYLLLIIGVGWTAVQHLDDLDPGKLIALWSGATPEGGPVVASQPTTTTQIHYPFQSESGTTASPPAPSVEPASANAPAAASVTAAVESPAPAKSPTATASPALPAKSPLPAAAGGETAAVASTPAAGPDTRDDDPLAPPLAREARLTLEFSDDCWVEVKSTDGVVLFSGLMRANTTRQITGPAPFTLTLGNAPAARITLDDRPVDTTVYVPRRGTVSRFTLDRAQL